MLGKKAFLIVVTIAVFIINSNNQELIHHIDFFECIFYHQSKTKRSCWFHKFLFYHLYFEFYSLNVSKISYSTSIFIFIIHLQHFCSQPLPFYGQYYHLLNTNKFLALIQKVIQSEHQLFHLSFDQPLFFLIIIFWLSWIITKVKRFFIVAKIFIDIFSFNFIH